MADARRTELDPAEAANNGSFAKQVLHGLNQLRIREEFTDYTINVDKKRFAVHKVVLAGLSAAFKSQISTEAGKRQSTLALTGVTAEVFEKIVDFAYTGEINVADNVEQVWQAALRLEAQPLIKACEAHCQTTLNFSNCLKFYCLGISKSSRTLMDAALDFIVRNFSTVAFHDDFVALPPQLVIHILQRDDLVIKDEEEVFEAATRWIEHKPDERKQYLFEVLRRVRLADLKQDFFRERVQNNEDIKRSATCMQLVMEALMRKLDVNAKPTWLCVTPRAAAALIQGLLVIGTRNDGYKNMALFSVADGNSWAMKPPPFDMKTMVASVSTGHAVYLMNCIYEVSERKYTSKAWRIQSNTGDWKELGCLNAEKKYTALIELKGQLYAIGGGPGNVVERYDAVADTWTYVAPLPVKVYFPAVVAIYGKIYVLGGTVGRSQAGTKTNQEISDAVQQYDPENNSWTSMPPLPFKKKRVLACAFNDRIYITDGTLQNASPSNGVYVFDAATSTWERGPPLTRAYANPVTMTVLSDRLTLVDTSRHPELQIETIGGNESWEACTKRLDPRAFKSVTRMFGGELKVTSG